MQFKVIKIGARVVRHAHAILFHLAGVAVTGPMVHTILAASGDCERHRHALDRDPKSRKV